MKLNLENVQMFALQVCLKSWDSEWNELLRVANLPPLNLPPLHKRQAHLSLCHLYKIIHNFTTSDIFHPYSLPGRPGHMLIDLFYSPNLSHSLTLISIPLYPMWNSLPQSVVCAPSLCF